MPKDLREALLVMIKTLGRFVVLCADINYNIAGIQDGLISGTLET